MKIKLSLIALIFSFAFANAQEIDLKNSTPINISYFGNFARKQGLKFGIEYPLSFKTKTKKKEKNNGQIKVKIKEKEFFLTGNLGIYNQNKNHLGLFLNSEIAYRKISTKGWKAEFLLGMGYLRTFNSGETFEVINGNVERVFGAGSNRFIPSFSFGFGRDLTRVKKKPFAWHFRPTVFFETPYNTWFNPTVSIELGITYHFSNLNLKK